MRAVEPRGALGEIRLWEHSPGPKHGDSIFVCALLDEK
jgi:hypothetical protein